MVHFTDATGTSCPDLVRALYLRRERRSFTAQPDNLILIENISIRQVDGLYCLNDLHKASGGENRHQPRYWLSNQQTIDLIHTLQASGIPLAEQNQTLRVLNGIGTFVCRELVLSYAAWVSAEFNLLVLRTFLDVADGKYQPAQQPALPDFTNPAVAARAWAEQFEQREKAERHLAIAGGALKRLGAADGSMCLRAAAKCLGMRQMDFINWCLQHKYLFRDGQGKLEAFACHTQNGWFEHKADEANGHAFKQVLVTPKGLMKLAQKAEIGR